MNSVLRKLAAQPYISWHYPFINSIVVLTILTLVLRTTCNMAYTDLMTRELGQCTRDTQLPCNWGRKTFLEGDGLVHQRLDMFFQPFKTI